MNLKQIAIYTVGRSPALTHARKALGAYTTEDPANATHLLLPVPSFEPDGTLKGGFSPEEILESLPPDITIIGGNLRHPFPGAYKTVDLLKDPFYTAQNAALTAHCALGLILTALPAALPGQQAMVIGYGRIGKCLSRLLQNLGADVTVAARKVEDRALAEALGFGSTIPGAWDPGKYRLIVNTVPAPVLDEQECRVDAFLLDLASVRGISGNRVHWARGLPGICVPETSGQLIACRALELIFEKEASQ